jgi:four helix bundle protein
MTNHTSHADDPSLDAERLDVYRLALEFQIRAARCRLAGNPVLRGQLERASVSIVLNIGEGVGRRLPSDKGRFYSIARGSAMECAAIFDILRLRRLWPEADCRTARGLLVRIVQMLTKLEAASVSRARDLK